MMLKMSLAEASAKAAFLRTKMFQKCCTVSATEFQNFSDQLTHVFGLYSIQGKTA